MAEDIRHVKDDMELMRTRVLRRITADKEFIFDALSAISKGKLNVATDLLERTLKEMNDEEMRLINQYATQRPTESAKVPENLDS
jgi:hypothetical protein